MDTWNHLSCNFFHRFFKRYHVNCQTSSCPALKHVQHFRLACSALHPLISNKQLGKTPQARNRRSDNVTSLEVASAVDVCMYQLARQECNFAVYCRLKQLLTTYNLASVGCSAKIQHNQADFLKSQRVHQLYRKYSPLQPHSREVHSPFETDFSKQRDPILRLPVYSTLSFPLSHRVAAKVFFLVSPLLLSLPLPFLQQCVLEGSFFARCDESGQTTLHLSTIYTLSYYKTISPHLLIKINCCFCYRPILQARSVKRPSIVRAQFTQCIVSYTCNPTENQPEYDVIVRRHQHHHDCKLST